MDTRLEIDLTFGKLGIDYTPLQTELDTPDGGVELDITSLESSLEQELPRMEIDQSEPLEDLGLYSPYSLRKLKAEEGLSTAREAAGRKASQGNELARIEEQGNPLVDQVVEEAWPEKQITIDMAPKRRPDIQLIEGQFDFEVNPGQVTVDLRDTAVNYYVQEGKAHIYLQQKPRVDIRV